MLKLSLDKAICVQTVRGDVKIQQPRPSVCRSQSPLAATEWLETFIYGIV